MVAEMTPIDGENKKRVVRIFTGCSLNRLCGCHPELTSRILACSATSSTQMSVGFITALGTRKGTIVF